MTGKLPIDDAWLHSGERGVGWIQWVKKHDTLHDYPDWEQSQEYREARLAFRKRANGNYSKGNH